MVLNFFHVILVIVSLVVVYGGGSFSSLVGSKLEATNTEVSVEDYQDFVEYQAVSSGSSGSSPTGFITVSVYSATSCSGTLVVAVSFPVGVCISNGEGGSELISVTNVFSSLLYATVSTYSGSSCQTLLSSQQIPFTNNLCFPGTQYFLSYSTSVPPAPGYGLLIDVYQSASICQAGSPIYSQGFALTSVCVSLQYAQKSILVSSCVIGTSTLNVYGGSGCNSANLLKSIQLTTPTVDENCLGIVGTTMYFSATCLVPVVPVANPTSSPIANPTSAPIAVPTFLPIANPTFSPIANPTFAPIAIPTMSPISNPTLAPVSQPTLSPSNPPHAPPTDEPTAIPTAIPSAEPSTEPTTEPTPPPTVEPSAEPSLAPIPQPTLAPSDPPHAPPTDEPTAIPTAVPTSEPSVEPSAEPTPLPTAVPTAEPTVDPTAEPSSFPTCEPTPDPSASPTPEPSLAPSDPPHAQPTDEPTSIPTADPTADPSANPSAVPTVEPSAMPTPVPSIFPSPSPSSAPVATPTPEPSAEPTAPTRVPTRKPTSVPSAPVRRPPTLPPAPTRVPTLIPTVVPSAVPSIKPTPIPSAQPTSSPTPIPTALPTPAVYTVGSFSVSQPLTNVSASSFSTPTATTAFQTAVASTMTGVSSNDVVITSVNSTSNRRLLRSDTSMSTLHRLLWLSPFQLEATPSVVVSYYVLFTWPGNASGMTSVYDQLTSQLNAAVSSGNFTAALVQQSVILNVTGLSTVAATAVPQSSAPVVVDYHTPSPSGAPVQPSNIQFLDSSASGTVYGVFAGVCLLAGLFIYLRRMTIANLAQISVFSMSFAIVISSLSFASNVVLAIHSIRASSVGVGAAILVSRLLYVLFSAALLKLTCTGTDSLQYCLSIAFSADLCAVSAFLMVFQVEAISYLPWTRSETTDTMNGFPRSWIMNRCTQGTVVLSVVVSVCSVVAMASVSNAEGVGAASLVMSLAQLGFSVFSTYSANFAKDSVGSPGEVNGTGGPAQGAIVATKSVASPMISSPVDTAASGGSISSYPQSTPSQVFHKNPMMAPREAESMSSDFSREDTPSVDMMSVELSERAGNSRGATVANILNELLHQDGQEQPLA